MVKGMKILLTGSTGFIGRAVAARLTRLGVPFAPLTGDVRERASFEAHEDCDRVLHLAGVTRTGSGAEEQQRLFEVNVLGTQNAMSFCARGDRAILFAGTCCYGVPKVVPTPETEPITYFEPYSFSKWFSEQALGAWNEFFGLRGMIFRIFNVYGPEQPERFLIPDLIRKIRDGNLTVYNFEAVRDFIYVDDLAELMVAAATGPLHGMRIVNAGSGRGASVGEVTALMRELCALDREFEDEGRPERIPVSVADMGLARRLWDWSPATPLREGLARVLRAHGMLPENNDETRGEAR